MKLGSCQKCGRPTADRVQNRCKDHQSCDVCGSLEDLLWGVGFILCPEHEAARIARKLAANAKAPADHDYTDAAVCPWCGYEHGDSWEMADGDYDCDDCGHPFTLTEDVHVTYTTAKVAADA